ncbi:MULTISPECIES: GAF domain-containing protein [Xanthomonas]|uniref:GAF domain-containing protein n=1 Tax=Xanthomonas dyei TaxID=743699 RepID=A0ABZ0D4Y3_9XANT|nr:GAF domain-containing protein [Xanthomonas dyei]WOB25336.1 GAF domain-containing protein [Xanthomonas dyei]WOB52963.1 GAF domain-containing protein [Xanthomonas dyei]
MLIAPYPQNEQARLRLLRQLDILDTPAESVLDEVTHALAQGLDVPIALISLVEGDRQWFKSKIGLDACQTSRDVSFCAHALSADEPLIVNDALMDERFADNPLVQGPPYIRFYAGVPLRGDNGLAIGTLCAIDAKPKEINAEEIKLLRQLASKVSGLIFSRLNDGALLARSKQKGFEISPVAMAVFDGGGRVTAVNSAFCRLLEKPANTLESCNASALWSNDSGDFLSLQHCAGSGAAFPVRVLSGEHVTGRRAWLRVVEDEDYSASFVALLFVEEDISQWGGHE